MAGKCAKEGGGRQQRLCQAICRMQFYGAFCTGRKWNSQTADCIHMRLLVNWNLRCYDQENDFAISYDSRQMT